MLLYSSTWMIPWIVFGGGVGLIAAWAGRVLTRILPASRSWYEGAEFSEAEPAPPGYHWKGEEQMPPAGVPVLWWVRRGRPLDRRGELGLDIGLILSGIIIAAWHGPGVIGFAGLMVGLLCYLIARMDHDHNWIPDFIVIPLTLAGLLASPFDLGDYSRIVGLSMAMATIWVVFALYGRTKGIEVMAGGDVILAGAGGAWLGAQGAPAFLVLSVALFVTHVLILHIRSGQTWKSVGSRWNAMGPAMCLALVLLTLFTP